MGITTFYVLSLGILAHLVHYKYGLKVRKFQNENMKSSHCPKYERKIWKFLPWILKTEFFKCFCSYFGLCAGSLGNLLKKFFQPSKCSLLNRKSNIAKSQLLKIWFFDHFWANYNYGNAKTSIRGCTSAQIKTLKPYIFLDF